MGIFDFLRKKKNGLLDPEPEPPKRMGAGVFSGRSLEEAFDKRIPIIFGTKSPVNSLAGPPRETDAPPSEDFKPRFSGRFMQRLMEDRESLDKIYSRGYFENHYPEADKQLKEFLHEKTMSSWAKTLTEDSEEPEEKEDNPGLTLVININK